MEIFMPLDQKKKLVSILNNTTNYLEFGCGGSTIAASKYIKGKGYSIESEKLWSEKVKKNVGDNITIIHIDIENEANTWGSPGKNCPKEKLKNYSKVDNLINLSEINTVLIDGRFRVSCALQIHKHINKNCMVIFDDFFNRLERYGEVLNYYNIAEKVNNMAILFKKDIEIPENIYEKYLYNPG